MSEKEHSSSSSSSKGSTSTPATEGLRKGLTAVHHQRRGGHRCRRGSRKLVLLLRGHQRPLLTEQTAATDVDAAAVIYRRGWFEVESSGAHAASGRPLGIRRDQLEGVDSDAVSGALVVDDNARVCGRLEEEAAEDDRPRGGQVRINDRAARGLAVVYHNRHARRARGAVCRRRDRQPDLVCAAHCDCSGEDRPAVTTSNLVRRRTGITGATTNCLCTYRSPLPRASSVRNVPASPAVETIP